jgi:hypothetical protein
VKYRELSRHVADVTNEPISTVQKIITATLMALEEEGRGYDDCNIEDINKDGYTSFDAGLFSFKQFYKKYRTKYLKSKAATKKTTKKTKK